MADGGLVCVRIGGERPREMKSLFYRDKLNCLAFLCPNGRRFPAMSNRVRDVLEKLIQSVRGASLEGDQKESVRFFHVLGAFRYLFGCTNTTFTVFVRRVCDDRVTGW